MKSYFTEDGGYGDGNYAIIIDTDQWTEDDWQSIEDCTENERLELAQQIHSKYTQKGNNQ